MSHDRNAAIETEMETVSLVVDTKEVFSLAAGSTRNCRAYVYVLLSCMYVALLHSWWKYIHSLLLLKRLYCHYCEVSTSSPDRALIEPIELIELIEG